jgi:response regulator RpfG family c-di-GMP phosphodiesterase
VEVLSALLVAHELLTEFQACLVCQGRARELRVGRYRIRDRVRNLESSDRYVAEHIFHRRRVHLRFLRGTTERAKSRDFVRADLHPSIVAVRDIGEWSPSLLEVPRSYVVSDFVEGDDFATFLAAKGRLATDLACDLMYQIVAGLDALWGAGIRVELDATNLWVTPNREIKLVELARRLGTSNEESTELESVICTLGGLMFWCVTGQPSGCSSGWHPRLPREVEGIVRRARSPYADERYRSLCELKNALAPLRSIGITEIEAGSTDTWRPQVGSVNRDEEPLRSPRVLIVDDDPEIRSLCRFVLEPHGIHCEEAPCGTVALVLSRQQRFDLVLLDMAMPDMAGDEVCRRLRANPPVANLKILMFSGHMSPDELAHLLEIGADDYVTKPFSVVQLLARIKAALRLKEAQDRADEFHHGLLGTNQILEKNLHSRDLDLVDAHKALVLAMAKLVECRDSETGAHVRRLQAYSRRLAEEAATLPAFTDSIDSTFLRWLEWGAPLHDIGKAGIPDAILRKEGPLDDAERRVIQTHTVLGANTLKEVARQHGSGMAFLQMAIDIARHHHERFDGNGYPDALAHHDIPLSARLVAIADVYDALRSRRVYKPPFPHDVAVHTILAESPGQFDPALLRVFSRCAADFDKIFCEAKD